LVILKFGPDVDRVEREDQKKFDIYQILKERILFLEYPPGRMLNERALTEEFAISRTPLREALNRLEWEGLIRILPRTGSIVSELEFEKIVRAYQIRLEIEGLVCRLAAENISDEHLAEIDRVEQDCRKLLDQKDIKKLGKIDFRLRDILYGASNNPLLRDISDYLYNITIRLWYFVYERGDWKEEVSAYLDEIVLTKKVLAEKDPVKAGETRRSCLAMHIERIKNRFLSWTLA
jgi:DNA-binding GntR family transcriptional regulator